MTKTINLSRSLFGSVALASVLGGLVFMESAVAQESFSNRHQKCYTYTLFNQTNRDINFNIGQKKSYLHPQGKLSIKRCFKRRAYHPFVTYDAMIGDGYKPERVRLSPGRNGFDRQGRTLILTTGENGPVTNSVDGADPNIDRNQE